MPSDHFSTLIRRSFQIARVSLGTRTTGESSRQMISMNFVANLRSSGRSLCLMHHLRTHTPSACGAFAFAPFASCLHIQAYPTDSGHSPFNTLQNYTISCRAPSSKAQCLHSRHCMEGFLTFHYSACLDVSCGIISIHMSAGLRYHPEQSQRYILVAILFATATLYMCLI